MMRFRHTRQSDLPQLLELWLDSFDEKEEAAKLFFERNLSGMHAYLAEEDGAAAAAVYLIGCTLGGKPAHYLCGAATRRRLRGRGIMTALINFALSDAQARGDRYSALLPADEGLYRFYGRLGYVPCGAACKKELCAGEESAVTEERAVPGLRGGRDGFLLWNRDYKEFARAYYACYGVKCLESARLFALYSQNGACADVFYAEYTDLEELKESLFREGIRRFTLTGSAADPVFGDCEPFLCGMAKPLQKDASLPDRLYIGLTLN